MSLKNFSKIELKTNNKSYWKLYKLDGTEVIPFTDWCLFVQNKYAYTTRDKYAQVVAKFLDYLVEVNIFEQSVTRLELKESIDNYKLLLHVGKSVSDLKLKKIAEELDFNKIAPASWSNNISVINSFLKFVFEKEEDEREYLYVKNGIHIPIEFKDVLPELNRIITLNQFQKEAIKQKSFLANLCRKVGEIKVSAGIKSDINVKSNIDLKRLDFPAIELSKLLSNTSCYRDRAIYSLLAGTGIRTSEALALKWDLIDITNQKVYIKDPSGIYSSDQMINMVKQHLTKVSVSSEKEYILTRIADANSYSQFNNPENTYKAELLRKEIVKNLNLIDYYDLNVTEHEQVEIFCAMIQNMLKSNQITLDKLVQYDAFKSIEFNKQKSNKLFQNKQMLLLK